MGISSFFPGLIGQNVLGYINQFSPVLDIPRVEVQRFPDEVLMAGRMGPVDPVLPRLPQMPSFLGGGAGLAGNAAEAIIGNDLNLTLAALGFMPNPFFGIGGAFSNTRPVPVAESASRMMQPMDFGAPSAVSPFGTVTPRVTGLGAFDDINSRILQYLNASPTVLPERTRFFDPPSRPSGSTTTSRSGEPVDTSLIPKALENAFKAFETTLRGEKPLTGTPTPAPAKETTPPPAAKAPAPAPAKPAVDSKTNDRSQLRSAIEQTQAKLTQELKPVLDKATASSGAERTKAVSQARDLVVKDLQSQGFKVKAEGSDRVSVNGRSFDLVDQGSKTVKAQAK
jgi:hypothetical protein